MLFENRCNFILSFSVPFSCLFMLAKVSSTVWKISFASGWYSFSFLRTLNISIVWTLNYGQYVLPSKKVYILANCTMKIFKKWKLSFVECHFSIYHNDPNLILLRSIYQNVRDLLMLCPRKKKSNWSWNFLLMHYCAPLANILFRMLTTYS